MQANISTNFQIGIIVTVLHWPSMIKTVNNTNRSAYASITPKYETPDKIKRFSTLKGVQLKTEMFPYIGINEASR